MSEDDDHKDKIVDLAAWRNKKIKAKPEVVWVSDGDPRLIVKINPTDLTTEFAGYKSNYKCFYKRLSLVEIVDMIVAIQNFLAPSTEV